MRSIERGIRDGIGGKFAVAFVFGIVHRHLGNAAIPLRADNGFAFRAGQAMPIRNARTRGREFDHTGGPIGITAANTACHRRCAS